MLNITDVYCVKDYELLFQLQEISKNIWRYKKLYLSLQLNGVQ